jgi:hypothetical protein
MALTTSACTLLLLGDATQIESTLYVSNYPRQPRRMQPLSLLQAFTLEFFCAKTVPMEISLNNLEKNTLAY